MTEFPMHYAVDNGDLKKVRELIDFGLYMNDRNSRGETPLIVAARGGHREIFDLLIQYGAQVNCERDSSGRNPFHWACYRGWVDQVRIILEKRGADPNAASKYGETPLMVAASRGHREIFDLLIQYGAQVNCGTDSDGFSTLHWASSKGLVDQVRLILEKGGADLNTASKNGETPLIVAAVCGHREIFNLLIQYGAQVNCGRDSYGRNPFHWACYRGWVDQVRIILEKGGADLNAVANDGNTPLKVAARFHRKEIFILLFQYGATMDVDYALISKHSVLENIFKDADQCTQLIVNKFQCLSLPTLYRNPDIAKRLPILKYFNLKDQQKQQIAEYVESEVKTKKFCNLFNSEPIVLMLLCVKTLICHQSSRKISASSDSNLLFKKPRLI